jgi:hypothetical protein
MRKFLALLLFAAAAATGLAQTGSYNAMTVWNTLTLPGATTITTNSGILQVSAGQAWNFGSAATFAGQLTVGSTTYCRLQPGGTYSYVILSGESGGAAQFYAGATPMGVVVSDASNMAIDSGPAPNLLFEIGEATKATLTASGLTLTGSLALGSPLAVANGGTGAATVMAATQALTPASHGLPGTNVDWSIANSFYVTLGGSTSYTFNNAVDGQTIRIAITGASNYTVTWPACRWPGGSQPVQSLAHTDVWTFTVINNYYYGSVVQNCY